MTISYVQQLGANQYSTVASLVQAMAGGLSPTSGNLIVAIFCVRTTQTITESFQLQTFTKIADFTGTLGSFAADSGQARILIYAKVTNGTETGAVYLAYSNLNGSTGYAAAYEYSKTGDAWNFVACGGVDETAGTAWSVTGNSDPGISAGDVVIAASAINTDAYTYSSEAISATGISAWGTMTERADLGSTAGYDCRLVISDHPVTTGTSSAAPVYTMTASSSGTNNPAGATAMIRIREVSNQAITASAGGLTLEPQAATIDAPGGGTPVTITTAAGALSLSGQPAAILPGAVIVTVSQGALTLEPQSASIDPGAVIVTVQAGALTLAPQSADIVPGAVSVTANAGALSMSGQAASIVSGAAIIQANAGTISLAGQQAGILPGAVTISAQAVTLALHPLAASIESIAIIPASVGELALEGQQAAIVTGGASILAGVGALSIEGQQATVTVIKALVLLTVQARTGTLTVNERSDTLTVAARAEALTVDDRSDLFNVRARSDALTVHQ